MLRLCIRATKEHYTEERPQGIRLSLTPASGKCQYPYQLQRLSTLLLPPLFLAFCLWRFVSLCSISGAANAHNVNYYNEPKQANQASWESQLSAELTFVYCLWLRFRLLPREQQSEARHEDKTVYPNITFHFSCTKFCTPQASAKQELANCSAGFCFLPGSWGICRVAKELI